MILHESEISQVNATGILRAPRNPGKILLQAHVKLVASFRLWIFSADRGCWSWHCDWLVLVNNLMKNCSVPEEGSRNLQIVRVLQEQFYFSSFIFSCFRILYSYVRSSGKALSLIE
jgi:hypothetical protein